MKRTIPFFSSSFKLFYTCICIALAGFMLACSPPDWANSRQTILSEVEQPLLVYQKTPCYGPCPAYDAHIYTDGSVLLKAWSNVPFTDTLRAQLTQKELAKLKRDLRHLPFQEWLTNYRSQRTDHASTYFTFITEDGEEKKVWHQEGGPESLLLFEKKMDALMLGVISRSVSKK